MAKGSFYVILLKMYVKKLVHTRSTPANGQVFTNKTCSYFQLKIKFIPLSAITTPLKRKNEYNDRFV